MSAREQGRLNAYAFIESTRSLDTGERVKKLEHELEVRLLEGKLLAVESLESLAYESDRFDPRSADDDVVDEVGLIRSAKGVLCGRTERDLEEARNVGRALWQENEYAIGAHENRVSYTVGTGLRWSLVPLDPDGEDKAATAEVNAALDRVIEGVDPDGLGAVEQEALRRGDRDGEALLRLFFPAGPMRARFMEPEDVKAPLGQPDLLFGVETEPGDVRTVVAYHTPGLSTPSIPAADVVHLKLNVDLNSRRGWPTMWPIRRPLARAEKLLRNMSYVAALQAAIALIRKHEVAGQAEIQAFLAAKADFTVTRPSSGRTETSQVARPGTVWDAGPGTSYEAPVSSVNASNNVLVLGAELRACAARLNMPEFMFSGDASNNDFASILIAEGPSVKGFERLQAQVGHPMRKVVRRGLAHEENRGALPFGILKRYKLVVSYPGLTVRERLQEAQTRQILHGAGVLSTLTWRKLEGLDDQVEERNLTTEGARGYSGVRGPAVNGEVNKPKPKPTGQKPGDNPGGSNKADPENPLTARVEALARRLEVQESVARPEPQPQPITINAPVTVSLPKPEPTHVTLQDDRTPPPPAAPPSIVINNNTEAAPTPNVTVQAPITVQPAAVTVEPGPAPVINVDARTTIEEGAVSVDVKGGDKKIEIKRDPGGRMTGADVRAKD